MMDTEKISEAADHRKDFTASIHTFRRTLQALRRLTVDLAANRRTSSDIRYGSMAMSGQRESFKCQL
jgi:hypothetical protein